jgi:predicted dinucleotide-binding enzyme
MQRMSIGILGAGFIGGTLAVKCASLGHRVLIANSKTPSTLTQFEGIEGLTPVWAADAAQGVDALIISVPESRVQALSAQLKPVVSGGTVVIDTGNYYPNRDGRIADLDQGKPDSLWVSEQLGQPIYKAFNNIGAPSLKHKGTTDPARRVGLAVAGPDGESKRTVFGLVEQLGFGPVDGGSLEESWRQQPGTPSYCRDFDPETLERSLAQTTLADVAIYHRDRDRIVDFDAATAALAKKM